MVRLNFVLTHFSDLSIITAMLFFTYLFFTYLFFHFFPKTYPIWNVSLKQSPFFSIIIPSYNRAAFLNRSIHSITQQHFPNIEIIVVDDNSQDNSVFQLKSLKEKLALPYLRIIQNKENKGTLITRIIGINSCTGEFMLNLDPDDQFSKNLFQTLFIHIQKKKSDIIHFRFYLSRNGIISEKNYIHYRYPTYSQMNHSVLLQEIMGRRIGWSLCFQCLRKSIVMMALNFIFPSIRNKSLCNGEDMVICFSCYIFCKKYSFLDFFGYIYYFDTPCVRKKCKNDFNPRAFINDLYHNVFHLKKSYLII
ncbi:Beta-1,3-galactosyltransferase [Tritrichomonas foetus]|uniref:Beta-1,3-galactosyltransferase n=1 Tax=Tritrichomonas foetus TaxID=1144522 RepID=A0A1J4KV03_9EUKA|nr:Beta-1,3-galactosyltransferase [Tritrichomonas foetus]|eukprot:OHT15137.1 Beta-1,3-galactosyltransferase [Tritrichomonas foetus]